MCGIIISRNCNIWRRLYYGKVAKMGDGNSKYSTR